MRRSVLLLAALAAGCTGDDVTTTGLVTADIVEPVDTSGEPDADAESLPDVALDDTWTEPDVDTPLDVPDLDASDLDAPNTDSADATDSDLPDVPDVEPDPVDISDAPGSVDADDVEPIDVGDAEDLDVEPDTADVIEVPDVVTPPAPLVLGTLAGAIFTPLLDGVDLEITQGPQGGIHLEVGIDVAWDSEETKLSGVLSCRTRLGAKDVGFNETPNFILYRAPEGTYRSVMIPVYFQDWDAAVYVDQNVAVSCTFTVGDVLLEDGAVVHLVDLF